MSLFSTPEDHAANSPDTWQVVKTTGGRGWRLQTKDGVSLESFTTKRAAELARTEGFFARTYAEEGRWYAGETPAGRRSWAECLAERERIAARRAKQSA